MVCVAEAVGRELDGDRSGADDDGLSGQIAAVERGVGGRRATRIGGGALREGRMGAENSCSREVEQGETAGCKQPARGRIGFVG